MPIEPEVDPLVQEVRTVSNKLVEIFERLREMDERLNALLERIRKCEDRDIVLEKELARKRDKA